MTKKIISTIDLNTVDADVLVKKLKISARLANRIVSLRPYQSVEQLNKIWGIDPLVLERIIPLVSVSHPEPTPDLRLEETSTPPEIELPSAQKELKRRSLKSALKQEITPVADVVKPVPALSRPKAEKTPWKVNAAIVLILFIGAFFRFTGLNWDDGQHQHPDERYVTMVADQIKDVSRVGEYFNTETSTLNPLRFGSYTYGMFPLFITHRVAEWMGMSNYDSITLVGRAMSGFFDLLALWMLYLLGKRLYNHRVGLLAAALGAAAVLPIQLSHYFTVDSFSTVFVIAGFYFAIQAIPIQTPDERISRSNLIYFALFGFTIGLAGACKVNTLPVFGIIILAGIIRIITEWKKPNKAK